MSKQVEAFLTAAKAAGFTVSVSRGIVQIAKTFTAGDLAAFRDCDFAAPTVLGLAPLSGGSVWGTDGGSVGGSCAVKQGRYELKKSGTGSRFIKALEAAVSQ